MKLTIAIAFLLTIIIANCTGQVLICNTVEGYDIKALTKAKQWNLASDYGCLSSYASPCNFYFSFCRHANDCEGTYSACENVNGTSQVMMLGNFSTSIFYENEDKTVEGFYALYPSAPIQNITNTTSCQPSLQIQFTCDPEAIWLTPIGDEPGKAYTPDDISFSPTEHCRTIITVPYSGACREKPEGDGSKGLSGGAIFLIIFFVVFAMYFTVGIGYNYCIAHKKSFHVLPNSEFWVGFPIHMMGGIRCLIGACLCKGSGKGSSSGYESV